LCSKEPGRWVAAHDALLTRAAHGDTLHAPHAIVTEALFALCRKLADGRLTVLEHDEALDSLCDVLADVTFPPDGDAALISAAERIRDGYGCSRSADSLYIALAEHLAAGGPVELLTFDEGQVHQAAATAPTVTVTLLPQVPLTPQPPI
jgi:predicted nucleic acid-binding protein